MELYGGIFDGEDIHENADLSFTGSTGKSDYVDSIRTKLGAKDDKLRDMTFLPGLIDTHIHFFGKLNRSLMEWVNTPDVVLAIASERDAENFISARFQHSGHIPSSYLPLDL